MVVYEALWIKAGRGKPSLCATLGKTYPGSLYGFLQLQVNLQFSQEKKFKKLGIFFLIKILLDFIIDRDGPPT